MVQSTDGKADAEAQYTSDGAIYNFVFFSEQEELTACLFIHTWMLYLVFVSATRRLRL